MSNINEAIHDIHHMDYMASQNNWLNQIHPLAKLLVTVWYIVLVVSFDKYDFAGLLGMSMYLIINMYLADISLKFALKRLKPVVILVCFVGIANPILDREIITYVGEIAVRGGVISMITLMMKGICALLASYMLIITTTIERICYALRILHMPKIMVTLIMLIYRYIIVFLKEVERITNAYSMRAPKQKGVHHKAWGTLVGQLLLRSVDRAQNVYESMILRGYRGEYYITGSVHFAKTSTAYALCWFLILFLFRVIPVFTMVGNFFV